jgi:hypothetical protein
MNSLRPLILAALLALACAPSLQARQADAAVPEPNPADVASVDAIITALYASISGPMDEVRDWNRFRSLFAPGARLMPSVPNAQGGLRVMTPEEYWEASAEALAAIGFTEAEIGRTTESFGRITHAFSTYESYREDQGSADTPFARGINSIQLLHHEDRWWVVSIFWDSERPGNHRVGRGA